MICGPLLTLLSHWRATYRKDIGFCMNDWNYIRGTPQIFPDISVHIRFWMLVKIVFFTITLSLNWHSQSQTSLYSLLSETILTTDFDKPLDLSTVHSWVILHSSTWGLSQVHIILSFLIIRISTVPSQHHDQSAVLTSHEQLKNQRAVRFFSSSAYYFSRFIIPYYILHFPSSSWYFVNPLLLLPNVVLGLRFRIWHFTPAERLISHLPLRLVWVHHAILQFFLSSPSLSLTDRHTCKHTHTVF